MAKSPSELSLYLYVFLFSIFLQILVFDHNQPANRSVFLAVFCQLSLVSFTVVFVLSHSVAPQVGRSVA